MNYVEVQSPRHRGAFIASTITSMPYASTIALMFSMYLSNKLYNNAHAFYWTLTSFTLVFIACSTSSIPLVSTIEPSFSPLYSLITMPPAPTIILVLLMLLRPVETKDCAPWHYYHGKCIMMPFERAGYYPCNQSYKIERVGSASYTPWWY